MGTDPKTRVIRPPPVETERDTVRPPQSDATLLFETIEKGDRELFATRLYDYEQRKAAEVSALKQEIGELKARLETKEVQLATIRLQDELADRSRDGRLEQLEEFKIQAQPYVNVLAKATAPQVHQLNKPDTEATASAETARVLNLARYGDYIWKAIITILMILLGLVQAINAKQGAPTGTIPVPTVQPAGTGFAGQP